MVMGGPDQKLIERASMFRLAVSEPVLADSSRRLSRSFSIHVPDVLVFADSKGNVVQPWRVSMIYEPTMTASRAKGRQGTEKQMGRFLLDVREKLINVLRIAYRHGHDDLIVCNLWGRGDTELAANVEPTKVVDVVRNVLNGGPHGASDVGRAFRRITLMVCEQDAHAEDIRSDREGWTLNTASELG